MARTKKKIQKKPSNTKFKSPKPLLPIALSAKEQSQIKKKALNACKRSWQALKNSDFELKEFHEIERPLYEEWYNTSHQESFSEINSLRKKCDEYEEIFSNLLREIKAYGLSDVEAYKKITASGYYFIPPENNTGNRKYSKNEEPNFNFSEGSFEDDFEEDVCDCPNCRARRRRSGNSSGDGSSGDMESIVRALFEEAFEDVVDDMDEQEKEKLFEEFCDELGFDYSKFSKGSNDQNLKTPETIESTRKQCVILFRKIAKELHPDKQDPTSNGKSSNMKTVEIERDLWLRSVNAYEKLDYEALCNVWLTYNVFCQNNDLSGDFTVAMLKDLQHDLKNQNAEKRNQLRRYKKSGVLGFFRLPEKDKRRIFKEQKSELRDQIVYLSLRSRMMERDLKALEKKAEKFSKRSEKRSGQSESPQKAFNF